MGPLTSHKSFQKCPVRPVTSDIHEVVEKCTHVPITIIVVLPLKTYGGENALTKLVHSYQIGTHLGVRYKQLRRYMPLHSLQ